MKPLILADCEDNLQARLQYLSLAREPSFAKSKRDAEALAHTHCAFAFDQYFLARLFDVSINGEVLTIELESPIPVRVQVSSSCLIIWDVEGGVRQLHPRWRVEPVVDEDDQLSGCEEILMYGPTIVVDEKGADDA
jgi:hypothetical protein